MAVLDECSVEHMWGRRWRRRLGVVAGMPLWLVGAAPAFAGQDAGSERQCSDVAGAGGAGSAGR